jgi:hypothetical protein
MAKKLVIHFTEPVVRPISYRIKYWPTDNPTNITTINVGGSPAIIDNLLGCTYSGTIESLCDTNVYSVAVPFSVEACLSELSYTPCVYVTDPTIQVPAIVYLDTGVEDIATGVTLYDQNKNIVTGVLKISSSSGLVYNVVDGVVTNLTGEQC